MMEPTEPVEPAKSNEFARVFGTHGNDEAARLENLKAEVQSARQVLRAELAAVRPILGDIFRQWPGAVIAGVQYGAPPTDPQAAPSAPPSPEAIEARARELLAEAERTLGVQIADRVKALDYYRARARAELQPAGTPVIGDNRHQRPSVAAAIPRSQQTWHRSAVPRSARAL